MDVSAVRNALDSFDKAQKAMERQKEEEKAIAKKQEEKKDAERLRKKKEEQENFVNPVDKSAILQKSIGLGEAIAASIISSVIG
ncbi:MAG: hypothetical protein KatS3mg068_1929 [Candidatus Sericytochromatia bacterium]|nr:MAG: hypothetical protein KatS3mg068_1929 [Candidatus Sericytochromatia bacterium]